MNALVFINNTCLCYFFFYDNLWKTILNRKIFRLEHIRQLSSMESNENDIPKIIGNNLNHIHFFRSS